VEFIKKNIQIIETLGKIEDLHLAFFGKYYVRSNGLNGFAEYKIVVRGARNKGLVYLSLKQDAGEWKVVQAKIVDTNDKISIILGEDEIDVRRGIDVQSKGP